METCETCEEPLLDGATHCDNCGAQLALPENRLRGEIEESERREIVREATHTDRLRLQVFEGVRYQPNAHNVLKLIIECRHRDVKRVILRPEIPGVVLEQETIGRPLLPRLPTHVSVSFFAKEPGERVLRSLDIEVRREFGETEFYELMDQSVTLPIGEADGPAVQIGSVSGSKVSDGGVGIGDQIFHIQTNTPVPEPVWRDVALLRDNGPRFGAARELTILRPPSVRERAFRLGQLVVMGEVKRRVFLAAGRVVRFGRSKDHQIDGTDKNHFVVRVLPCISPDVHPQNWAHTKVISSRHGRFEIIGNKVFYVDTSGAGTLFDDEQRLARGDRVPLRDEAFKLQLGFGRAVLHGRLLRRFATGSEKLVVKRGYNAPTPAEEGPPGFASAFGFDGLWLRRDETTGATNHVYGALFRELRLSPSFEPLMERTKEAIRLIVDKGDLFIGGEGVELDIAGVRVKPDHVVPLRDGMYVRVGDQWAEFRDVVDSDFTPSPDELGLA